MYKPFREATINYNKILPVAKTRIPWFHKNFSGIPGWKQEFIAELEDRMELDEDQKGSQRILFKAFGRIVMLDSGKAQLWRLPKFKVGACTIKFGWLYWAIEIIRGQIYFIPDQIKKDYEFMSNKEVLHTVLREGMSRNDSTLMKNAMDIMLKLDYDNFRIQTRTISRSGDRIQYTITYPRTRIVIESVNGMQNHVLSAKYQRIISSINMDELNRQLLHKDEMTPEQLDWLVEEE